MMLEQEAGLSRGRAPKHPGAAYFAGGIVKSGIAIAAFHYVPAKDSFVELGRSRNVSGRHLDVTDFPIYNGRRHGIPFWASPF